MNTERPEHSEAPEGADPGRTSSRRPTALVVAVATAAVLLVGGGGAYLAASGGTDGRTGGTAAPGGAGGTPPPLTLDGWEHTGTGGIAPGEPDPYGTRYVVRGELPDGPGTAPVYEPRGEVGRDRVVRLAKALGIDGAPVAEGRIWRVGGQDGSGPSLTVNRDAPGSWSFDRYPPGTDNCRKVTVCAQDPGAPAGDPVSVAKAEKAAAPVLKAAGLDDAKLDAGQVMGARRVVNADPVVGGLPTYGWTTGLTVDRNGELVGGHGLLGAPVKGDTYPVLGAEKTLELMNKGAKGDHRMGIGGCASPVPLKDRLEQPCGASTGAPKPSADQETHTGTVTVEKAVFGLAAHSVGGRQTLVPSWLFRVRGSAADDAFTVTYPAVDPKYLTSASAPSSPSSSPSSAPSASGAPGKSRSVQVNAYTAEGRTLNLGFYGGVCADYTTSARESGDRVTVTVTEKPWPNRVCVLMAKQYVKTVTLHAPLDGRTVVGTDGKAVPKAKPGSLRPDASARAR
ncbi:hypothetical protein [Streptomyces cyanogenus]|uniref:Large membrane protein n=1 Tax=Streptomyces cyanogenus TaxID=80860 RepID=A0ABX7TN19_STRCY|nr:hypothetical protein [Streptomyces cyanogenus]QTD98047.1 hypothetical protein S1361_11865 [Streptomyces cyanogenus]